MSALLSIYDALETMAVNYIDKNGSTVNPTVYNLDALPNSIQTAQLPCRLLFPLGDGGKGMTLTLGPGNEATNEFSITDFFLLETLARGEGPYIHSPVLVRYASSYADAIALKWQFSAQQYISNPLTASANIVPGRYNIPAGSDVWFYGVRCEVLISELL